MLVNKFIYELEISKKIHNILFAEGILDFILEILQTDNELFIPMQIRGLSLIADDSFQDSLFFKSLQIECFPIPAVRKRTDLASSSIICWGNNSSHSIVVNRLNNKVIGLNKGNIAEGKFIWYDIVPSSILVVVRINNEVQVQEFHSIYGA